MIKKYSERCRHYWPSPKLPLLDKVAIKRDLGSFYEVGSALTEIRERGLYKIKNGGFYKTFKAYAKGTWDMSQRHANRLIAASGVIDNLRPCGRVLPATEYHVRHLTKLTEDKQGAAWEMALETAPDGKVLSVIGWTVGQYSIKSRSLEWLKQHDEAVADK